MQIEIYRTKEDSLNINRIQKDLKLKAPQLKIFICFLIGLVFFFYTGDEIEFPVFSGYEIVAALFWGGGAMLYLETFYPKINFNAMRAIEIYKENETGEFAVKIELDDNGIKISSKGIFIRMDWQVFKMFSIDKKFIFLMRTIDDYSTASIIMKKELTGNQFNEFYEFLKTKMAEKKK